MLQPQPYCKDCKALKECDDVGVLLLIMAGKALYFLTRSTAMNEARYTEVVEGQDAPDVLPGLPVGSIHA